MGCILRASAGSVKVHGREVADLPKAQLPAIPRLRNFGFIFQGFNLFPALSARENVEIAFDLKHFSKRDARRKAEELLAGVGLRD